MSDAALVLEPFHSYAFAISPASPCRCIAFLIGWFIFRARVSGVYVAIITLAMLVVDQPRDHRPAALTGGFNGITDLRRSSCSASIRRLQRPTYYLRGDPPASACSSGSPSSTARPG
jgi:urea transport system permease protein